MTTGEARRDARVPTPGACESRFAVYSECPHCGSDLAAEHAHFRCRSCGWRDSCCD